MTETDRKEQKRLLLRLASGEQEGMVISIQRKLEAKIETLDKKLDEEMYERAKE